MLSLSASAAGGSPLMPMEAALSSLQMPELQESYTSVLRD